VEEAKAGADSKASGQSPPKLLLGGLGLGLGVLGCGVACGCLRWGVMKEVGVKMGACDGAFARHIGSIAVKWQPGC
jgi:hypothetical protein